ncbi:MAG: hypothetical protein COW00_15650 [Bdellovibrio sp. CG12_big_fil_rev_8_21_14_0_65_39_13]|nr:MAG: hypothetical protein COW78_05515 [Bdellovibrio sp. CG22_combo_CG10-13_8_21_14_all_39_27]PIQ58434.1 MAG: hypothetical protein COW00_15650 [Bdellovibrio sp. CG12_big_fil_rev_8_21_14_0_65_39_13]PIR35387.1 MAG: hypothetical protein COV37_07865 [Bdellovibrio sp. CG11_big_fil_rev_8_21_14_0_20_39_38]PJB52401.1 MAG: hypothetical protein CO099_12825 [Bdellovibrio sp. CG_4_9_14_3_um_filter_39_7]
MNKRVLLLDDSSEFLFLVSSLLKFHNIDVENVEDSAKALELVKQNDYAMIITDYLMDPMNGLEFAQEVRKEGKNQHTPLMLLTAKKLDEEETIECGQLKMVYVSKPVMPNDLYRKVMDNISKK